MHYEMNGYKPADIEVVAAFDVDQRKVGNDVHAAIFTKPNCTTIFYPELLPSGVTVRMGKILDGVAGHMKDYPDDHTFVLSEEPEPTAAQIIQVLKESGAQILTNYLPALSWPSDINPACIAIIISGCYIGSPGEYHEYSH